MGKIVSLEKKYNKLIDEYYETFEEYTKLCDNYELCDETRDQDVIDILYPKIQQLEKRILKLEKLLGIKRDENNNPI